MPYWREHGKIAADHGVTLCFEMHGGDMIYNPTSLMRLREAIGPVIACNFDISHMWYQGITPSEAVRFLGDVVQHVHAKDVSLEQHNIRIKGLMDNSTPENPANAPGTTPWPGGDMMRRSGRSLSRPFASPVMTM